MINNRRTEIRTLPEIEKEERTMLETINSYERKQKIKYKVLDPDEKNTRIAHVVESCLTIFREEVLSKIDEEVVAANKHFNDHVGRLIKEYGHKTPGYNEQYAQWSQDNSHIVEGRKRYCAIVKHFDDKYPQLVNEFVSEKYDEMLKSPKKSSKTSASPFTVKDRSFTI